MKYITTIILAVLISVSASSQGLFSLNYALGFPTGETSDYIASTSFRGFSVDSRYFLNDQFSLSGSFTWSTFYEKLAGASYTNDNMTITGTQYRYLNAFPILFQAHYYLDHDVMKPRVYVGGGIGPYIMNQRTDVGIWSKENNYWHFGVSPEIGLLYPLSRDTKINIGLKYHYVFKAKKTIDYSWFGLNIGFAWGD